MNQHLRYLFVSLMLGMSLESAHAADLTDHPGYLDVDQLSYIDGREPNVEITLNGAVLKMLLQLPVKYDDDAQTKELLKSVDQILVRVYNVDPEQADNILALIGETSETLEQQDWTDRKSTRLNSSHLVISYAVFCSQKKRQYSDKQRTGNHGRYQRRADAQQK